MKYITLWMLTVLLGAAVAAPEVSEDKQKAVFKTVETLRDNIQDYQSLTVVVSGTVSAVEHNHFMLESGGTIFNRIPVQLQNAPSQVKPRSRVQISAVVKEGRLLQPDGLIQFGTDLHKQRLEKEYYLKAKSVSPKI